MNGVQLINVVQGELHDFSNTRETLRGRDYKNEGILEERV
jgi:hypothetical protein